MEHAHHTTEYRSLNRRIRPARIATRVPDRSEHWEHAAVRVMENYSTTWGGSANLLVPIDEVGIVEDAFWPLIELFDADIWNWYVFTLRGQAMANPDGFSTWLESQAAQWAAEHGGSVADARQMLTADHLMTGTQGTWPPPREIAEALMRRTAPAFTRGGNLFGLTRADDIPGHNAVDVSTLSPLPPVVTVPDVSSLPIRLHPLVCSQLGALSPGGRSRLIERGVHVDDVSIDVEDVAALVRFALRTWGNVRAFGPGGTSRFVDEASFETSPASLSEVGWQRVRFADQYSDDGPIVLVVGDHARDFCFAHALERCGVIAAWLPGTTGLDDDDDATLVAAAALALGSHANPDPANRTRIVTSVTLGPDEMRRRQQQVANSQWFGDAELHLLSASDVPLPRRRLPALLDPEVFNEHLEEPFVGDTTARAMPPAYPSKVSGDSSSRFTWWVDVEDLRRPLPARSALNAVVVASTVGWGKQVRCPVCQGGVRHLRYPII